MHPDRIPVPPGRLGGDGPAWRDCVADDAKGRLTAAQSAALRAPDLLDDWIAALIELKRATEANLADSRSTAQLTIDPFARREAVRSHADVSRRAIHFLQAIEERLHEAKASRVRRDTAKSTDVRRTILTRLDDAEFRLARLERSVQAVALDRAEVAQ